ncbi:unnamed protein product, partial [Ectocarpus sp. 4 AP-2014]
LACLLAVGCGDGLPTAYPVSGLILVDGEAVAGVELVYYPTTPFPKGLPIPTPRAFTDRAGRYTASTYTGGDGAPAGEYRLAVLWMTEMPEGGDPEEFMQTDRLAGKYADPLSSGITVTVVPGDNELPTIELSTRD